MVRITSLEECPPAPLLLLISYIEPVFRALKGPQWREDLPFGLGLDGGLLSHEIPDPLQSFFPKLLTFNDYLNSNVSNSNVTNSSSPIMLSSVYTFLFETSTTSLGDLTSADSLFVLAILIFLLRQIKKRTHPLFCSIGRSLGKSSHGLKWVQQNSEKITKFGEYVFRLLYHFSLSAYGVYYFWDKPWWNSQKGGTALLFHNFPFHDIDVGMIWYYLIQSAYNVDAFVSLLELSFDVTFFRQADDDNDGKGKKSEKGQTIMSIYPVEIAWSPTIRGDFPEMLVHHIITNCLVFGSSYCRFTRIGSMVFLIHDISDVPVDMSKLANFVKWTKTTVFCFISMVLLWMATRMTILPFVIVKSVWYESHLIFSEGIIDARIYKMYFALFFTLLCGITALHYFWFSIFIKIAQDLTKGKVQDYAEHKKGEPEALSLSQPPRGKVVSKED